MIMIDSCGTVRWRTWTTRIYLPKPKNLTLFYLEVLIMCCIDVQGSNTSCADVCTLIC